MRKLLMKIGLFAIILTEVCGAQEKITISADQWQPAKGAKEDKGSLSIQIPADSKIGDLISGLRKPLVLEPGVYRIKALVKAEPLLNMGYRILLTVRKDKEKATYNRLFHPKRLTIRNNVLQAKAEKRAFQHNAQNQIILETDLAVTKKQAYQIAVGWKVGESHFFYRGARKNNFPASLKSLKLENLTIEKQASPLLLGTMTVNKVVYKPGEAPRLTVPVTWTGSTKKQFSYHVKMYHDLEPAKIISKGTFPVKPHQKSSVSVTLPALKKFGGYRFDFEVLDGTEVVASCERSAACSSRYNRIGTSGTAHGFYINGSRQATVKNCQEMFGNLRDAYLCEYEIGFWQPDNFSNLTPEKDIWMTAEMTIHEKQGIKNLCAVGKENGFLVNAYLKGNYADGRDGLVWSQKHPELVYYHRDTGAPMGNYNLDHILNWDEYEKKLINRKKVGRGWHFVVIDPGRPSVVDVSVRETLNSEKMFGWGGVRFDGDFNTTESETFFMGPVRNLKGKLTATPDDWEVTYANMVKRYKRKIRSKLPEFEFGFNHQLNDSHQRLIVGPAIASDGSMVMNESNRGFGSSKQAAYNKWEEYASLMSRYSRIVRSWGGFYQPIGCYGMRADDYLYQSVFVLAAQAKPYGPFNFSTPLTVRMTRFVVRFAGIMCADMYPVPAPQGRITVTPKGKLWWKPYANYIENDLDNRDYIIQLINPPVSPNANNIDDPNCLLREPVKDVTVSLDLDSYEKCTSAWLLDPWDENDLVEVPVKPRPDGVDIKLPKPVSIWSVLVVRCKSNAMKEE